MNKIKIQVSSWTLYYVGLKEKYKKDYFELDVSASSISQYLPSHI